MASVLPDRFPSQGAKEKDIIMMIANDMQRNGVTGKAVLNIVKRSK
jgi:hypothetical protein